jgi:two-component system sensor histidine kinase DesK
MPGYGVQADWLIRKLPWSSDGTGSRAAAGPPAEDSWPGPPDSAAAHGVYGGQRLARGILLTVLCGFLAVQLIDLLASPIPSHGTALAVDIFSICVVFILQLFISAAGSEGWSRQRRLGMLLAQGLITYLPLLILGRQWAGMTGFLAGSILLLIPGVRAWLLFSAVIASMLVGPLILGLGAYSVAYLTVASLDIGLIVFGLSRLNLVIRYVHATRAERAQLAVVRERMRFARDLHDLLGYSLSAITLKAELTRRLVAANPERARDELAEVLDIARQALADVRLVASGYRNMSLSKEAASVTSLLATAGIAGRVDIDCESLDEATDTVLATVLREAVTNLLRHSAARNCAIEAALTGDEVRLRVTNDGVPQTAGSHRDGGGLENLALRLEAVGGTLAAGVSRDGRFEVLATVPGPAAPGRRSPAPADRLIRKERASLSPVSVPPASCLGG